MSQYNGHKNYDYWNVSLWLGNDESLYRTIISLRNDGLSKKAIAIKMKSLLPEKTPDGAVYTLNNIKEALKHLID